MTEVRTRPRRVMNNIPSRFKPKPKRTFQEFWVLDSNDEYQKIEKVVTLIDFAKYMLKDVMHANDLRFITKEKKRFTEMWKAWLIGDNPKNKDLTPRQYADIIATEILSGYNIKHRKANSHPSMIALPINSRYKQRVHYCLKVFLTKIIEQD